MITKKAEYGIIILAELARAEKTRRVTTREITLRGRIPGNLIIPLIGILRQAGWVNSTRGPSGGIVLARDPATITLREVIELFDGPIGITRCLMQDQPCHDQVSCPLRGVWSRAQAKMLEVLEQTTVAELSGAAK